MDWRFKINMNKLSKLINQYYNHKFDEDWGYNSRDYISFQTKYKNVLKEIGNECGVELYSFNGGYYEFSCVMKSKYTNRFYYVSICDVRTWKNEWADNVLYRTMEHDKDWTGGSNHFCKLEDLGHSLNQLDRQYQKNIIQERENIIEEKIAMNELYI